MVKIRPRRHRRNVHRRMFQQLRHFQQIPTPEKINDAKCPKRLRILSNSLAGARPERRRRLCAELTACTRNDGAHAAAHTVDGVIWAVCVLFIKFVIYIIYLIRIYNNIYRI